MSAAAPQSDAVEIVVVPGLWETKCGRDELPMHHHMVLNKLRNVSNLRDGLVELAANLQKENDLLRAACRQIIAGWGHQDGVSKAVAMAREALGDV